MGPDVQTNSLIPAVYLHIPFCLTRCGYCSFFSIPYSKPQIDDYIAYLYRETELFTQTYRIAADSIYFGGGTPSLLTAGQLSLLIDKLNPLPDAEITLEVNPIQITPEWLNALTKTKVNRLSLGLQSMQNTNLKALGRKHTSESMQQRIRLCREYGYQNISLDLMYGLPGSTEQKIEYDLAEYIKLNPEHISTYLLSIEDNLPLQHWQELLPDDAISERQFAIIRNTLLQAGFEHYELSNFAKEGCHGRHNLHYWMGDDYLGVGAGASGFVHGSRYQKPENIELWKQSIDAENLIYEQDTETLIQQKADFIIMQMRLLRGLDIQEYYTRFGSDFISEYQQVVNRFTDSGHLLRKGRYIRLAEKALFISNSIFREFV